MIGVAFRKGRHRLSAAMAIVLVLLAGCAVYAQTAPSQATANQDTNRPKNLPSEPPAAVNLETGKALGSLLSPLHWGRLSVLSFSAAEYYQTNAYLSEDNVLQQQQTTSFQALLSFLVERHGFQFNMQYQPRLWVANDTAQTDFGDQNLVLSTSRKLGRWSSSFSVNFSSASQRSQMLQYGTSPAALVNGTNRNAYLVNGGSALQAGSSLTLDRALGARDHLWFGVDYNFYRVKSPKGQQGVILGGSRQHRPGGNIGWSHATGRHSTFGLNYAYGMYFNGGEIDNHYAHHALMASLSFEPVRELKVSLAGGPAFSFAPKFAGAPSRLTRTYQSAVSVSRQFGKSEVAVTYGRDDAFRGIIGDSFNNHVDLAFGQTVGRRWRLSFDGSYLRQSSGVIEIQSWRGGGQLSYQISRCWSFYSGYSYLGQAGLPILNRVPSHFVSGGIRWSWSPETTLTSRD